MKPRQRCNFYWKLGLVWAGVLMLVLGDSTPAQNYIYSYLDSKGTQHITNVSLRGTAGPNAGPGGAASGRGKQTWWPRRPSLRRA